MPNHPLVNTDFEKWIGTNFAKYLLPIIPAGAAIQADSTLDSDHLGKTPGKWLGQHGGPNEWVGFFHWSTYYQQIKVSAIQRWHHWQDPDQAGVPIASALNSIVLIGFDADSDDPLVVKWMRMCMESVLGPTRMVRRRDGAVRFLAVYRRDEHTMPFPKMRFVGVPTGMDPKAASTPKHMFEILGEGCQFVMEGPHAKGSMHYWENEEPVHTLWDELPVINGDMAMQVKRKLEETCIMVGLTRVSALSVTTSSDRASAVKITDVTSEHIEADEERLLKAIECIDLNHPEMDYDAFITLQRAICAAVRGETSFINKIWPWICTQGPARGNGPRTEEQGQEWLETKWNSFTDSTVGARQVYRWAAECGHPEFYADANGEKAQEMFDALPDNPADGQGADGSVGGAQGASVAGGSRGTGSNGPLPPTWTDTAAANTFASIHPEYRFTDDQGWVVYKGGVYVPTSMVRSDIADVCAAIGAPLRAQGPQQAVVDQLLNASKKHAAVETRLRYHRSVYAEPAEFDADPWLLNTPIGIIDLRTGTLVEHTGQLMRHQTAVAPDIRAALYGYDQAMPRFSAYLSFISDGRDWVIPFLRRWGAYNLVGEIYDQIMLYIHGLPGAGKSTFSDIVNRLTGTYTKAVSKGFFMKALEKRTFELYQTRGKRGVFGDETPKGSSWDEILINSMLGGTRLSAEGKGRDFVEFRNVAKMTVTGNHKPSFITHSEESGIDRRLLILELNKKIAEHMEDNTKFAAEVAAAEGGAILMWLIEEAARGWESLQTKRAFVGQLAHPLSAVTRNFRAESNPYLEWINEQIVLDPIGSINVKKALGMFRLWQEEEHGVKGRFQETRSNFGTGMEAAGRLIKHEIKKIELKAGPDKGSWAFTGVRERTETEKGIDPNAKIVDIFTRKDRS